MATWYSNGLRVQDVSTVSRDGLLATAKWALVTRVGGQELRAGEEMFHLECSNCHTVDGYNGVRLLVRGWRQEFADYQLQRLNELKGFMPPFAGTAEERRALARWLFETGRGQPFSRVVERAGATPDGGATTGEVAR